MLWGGPCVGEGLPIATLCTGRLGPPAAPTAPGGCHGLAFNPFRLGELLAPVKWGITSFVKEKSKNFKNAVYAVSIFIFSDGGLHFSKS